MLKEPVTNAKPIGNGLVINALSVSGCLSPLLIVVVLVTAIKSVTDKFVLETHVEQVFYLCT
jgi:hypothetical protein